MSMVKAAAFAPPLFLSATAFAQQTGVCSGKCPLGNR
jgi:hypothetical protein